MQYFKAPVASAGRFLFLLMSVFRFIFLSARRALLCFRFMYEKIDPLQLWVMILGLKIVSTDFV